MNMRKRFGAAMTGALLMAGTGCGEYSPKEFHDKPGDIVAGEPAVIKERRYLERENGKSEYGGYLLYLVTKDCDTDGECETEDHEVDYEDYARFKPGDTMRWSDRDTDSVVLERRYAEAGSYDDATYFALVVKQCIEPVEPKLVEAGAPWQCVTDYVQVRYETWRDFSVGGSITFRGEPGDVVS